MIRKKSEHNEGIINTLEELSLHQEDVEKIEHINNWCKEIQILYLQANLIGKIGKFSSLYNKKIFYGLYKFRYCILRQYKFTRN